MTGNASVMCVQSDFGEVEGEEHLLQQVCFFKISKKNYQTHITEALHILLAWGYILVNLVFSL